MMMMTSTQKKRLIVVLLGFFVVLSWKTGPSSYIDHSSDHLILIETEETHKEMISSGHISPPSEKLEDGKSGSCDLYHGKWIHDPVGPLYTNKCTHITENQNCQGNGRPDKDYENWRWKPHHCDLPRFNATTFLKLMSGKTLAFIGDSVARNQMESLLCILSKVDAPRNQGSHGMQQRIFESTSTTIVFIWSSWLVNKTSPSFATGKAVKIHLDIPDEAFVRHLPEFDVAVLSSGHWFSSIYTYVLNGTILNRKIGNANAYGIAMDTILTAVATLPDYNGLTVVRTYSPDHYEGGAWNTGGSCSAFVRPGRESMRNVYTSVMHTKQVMSFERATKKLSNGAKLRLMDVTELSGYRHDGHPGKHRGAENTETKGGRRKKKRSKQDCLHWCMPGPIDTWNEILFDIMKREL